MTFKIDINDEESEKTHNEINKLAMELGVIINDVESKA